jgi:hypothetical protein
MSDQVNHPEHYHPGELECFKVAEAWGLIDDAYLFNVLKYLARHNKKGSTLDDLKKAQWYLNRRIEVMEKETKPASSGRRKQTP